jgi:uncharacterized membrane protein (UPF0127 family)
MNGMRFNIDIIWIAHSKIVGITQDAQRPKGQGGKLPLYSAPEPTDAVLEVPSGWTTRHHSSIGDEVTLP